jgi:hypothetical protein
VCVAVADRGNLPFPHPHRVRKMRGRAAPPRSTHRSVLFVYAVHSRPYGASSQARTRRAPCWTTRRMDGPVVPPATSTAPRAGELAKSGFAHPAAQHLLALRFRSHPCAASRAADPPAARGPLTVSATIVPSGLSMNLWTRRRDPGPASIDRLAGWRNVTRTFGMTRARRVFPAGV